MSRAYTCQLFLRYKREIFILGVLGFLFIFIYLFIYNNFICNNQYKKAAIREELNPHVR